DAGAAPTVRLLAAGTLARLNDPVAVTQLGAALRGDTAPEVRRACAQALGRFGGHGVVQALREAAPLEPDVIVRSEVVKALLAQGSAARAALAEISRSDPDATIRELARGSVDESR